MNRFLLFIYSSFISSQAWVSFCVSLFIWFFQLWLGLYNPNIIWFGFIATLLAYNLAYWVEKKSWNWRLPIIMGSAIILFYLFLQLQCRYTQYIILLGGVISFLYSNPLGAFKLREIPHFKILWIAMVWTMVAVMPYIEAGITWNWHIFMIIITEFLYIIGITIPFDIRDYKSDAPGLKTIPQLWGVPQSKFLAIGLLIISFISFFIASNMNFSPLLFSFGATIMVGIGLIYFQPKHQSIWYTTFWIEGLTALPWLIYKIPYEFIS